VIVATAGHVDHGKTSLVRALTGVDTDRLDEEKRRGMSIDLGFAYAEFGAALRVGFVDVPGHERFIRNMLAGVACIDMVLLVVAADDGPMPQTLEHLAILELLGVRRGAVALTKIDRVSAERAAEVERSIGALLAPGPLNGSPVFPLVATTGAGVAALHAHLSAASRAEVSRPRAGHFRLAIDRSFTVPGAGWIVTGAVVAGAARIGDTLIVSPHGIGVRVRGIHSHNQAADVAHAGARCALNLTSTELKRTAIARGDWVVAAPLHAPTDRLDVQLTVPAAQPKALADGRFVQLHLGAASVPARVAALEGRRIEPGESKLAQLVLDRPIGALHGDRFIIRDQAAQRTLGGGHVVDPFAPARGRARPARLALLAALAQPAHGAALEALLEAEPQGTDLRRFAQARNLNRDEVARLRHGVKVVIVADRTESNGMGDDRDEMLGIAPSHWEALRQRIAGALEAAHAAEPEVLGPAESALAAALGMRAPCPLLSAAIRSLRQEGRVVRDGFCLRLAAHVPRADPAHGECFEPVRTVLLAAGLRPPIVGDLAALVGIELPALLGFLAASTRRGQLVQVARNRFFLPETVVELVRIAGKLADQSADRTFAAAAYRDRSGLGRNLTIELLEFLDRAGVTRFRDGRRSIARARVVVT
jgi:selenocysteine-specific elongation factor